MGLDARNPSSGGLQPHRRRPACTSAQSDQCLSIHFLESIICKLAAGEISIFKLVSIAEETGLKHTLSTRVGVIKIVIVINCNLITFSKVIACNCN